MRSPVSLALAVLALLAASCGGGGPSTPTAPATPPPPVFPNMIGGWGGTAAQTYTVHAPGSNTTGGGSVTCNSTWLITSQTAGSFR